MGNAREIMAEKLAAWRTSPSCPSESVTHVSAATGTSTVLSAVVYRGAIQEEPFSDGRFSVQSVQITFLRSVLAHAAVDDTFAVTPLGGGAAETFTVRNIPFKNSAVIELVATRNVRKALQSEGDQRDRSRNQAGVT